MAIAQHSGFRYRSILAVLLIGLGLFSVLRATTGHAATPGSYIKSGISGLCLDDYKDGSAPNNKVLLWSCNNSAAQNWVVSGGKIEHGASCLSLQNDQKAPFTAVTVDGCNTTAPGQVWLADKTGYFNPNSGMCLTGTRAEEPVMVVPCGLAATSSQTWIAGMPADAACQGSEGAMVACYAEREWTQWQSGSLSHEDLLNKYTDGSPYEAWCADFVSYVYKQAGHPFTNAYDGWDENNANNIQNYGFTLHDAASGYLPKPGDIAYFDYNGGHVEIVVSGGRTPTFIYGNSATIDPATGNGQMKANTISHEGSEGNLVYYLSPTS